MLILNGFLKFKMLHESTIAVYSDWLPKRMKFRYKKQTNKKETSHYNLILYMYKWIYTA